MIKIKAILFVDDKSVAVSSPNITELEWHLNQVFIKINEQFNANFLSLNYSKTYYIQFQSKNLTSLAMNIINNNKLV
jgi:hypothetical protein